ncbi:DNA-binding transcriptional regulator, LysR family [Micromonospora echinospora]|uniref:DNA-binding transcriptional regulator, LysR family n=1 Tax=Micromonospora echinospora TaxID=1877 RepID=A0A1C4VLY4_MICEC|nr:LysR family transcriptional regulator [Micromonospora echinospora]SCE85012.1 DNA-binding transcriptional regulator, LysR family [Micromonospora echinospora]
MAEQRHDEEPQPQVVADIDLGAVRAFLAVVDDRYFGEAAARLRMSQQAVSKRIAALERDLGVRLFTRAPRGASLTVDGQAFLPHARDLMRLAERAVGSVRPGRRALRVDVLNRRIGPAGLLRDFHRAQPETELDVVTLVESDAAAAIAAVEAGTVDATFRAVTVPPEELPPGIRAARVLDDPHQLLTGPAHPLAAARHVTMADLSGLRIWIPGIVPGTEWAAYYDVLAAEFGLTIERIGPNFGTDHLLDVLADSPTLTSLVGERTRMIWPQDYDLRRVPVRDPTPVYPHFLVWHTDNPHPGLAALRSHIASVPNRHRTTDAWVPVWAAEPATP